jgi:hypothetical protein
MLGKTERIGGRTERLDREAGRRDVMLMVGRVRR